MEQDTAKLNEKTKNETKSLPQDIDWCIILRIDPNGDVWKVDTNDKKDRFCNVKTFQNNPSFEEEDMRVRVAYQILNWLQGANAWMEDPRYKHEFRDSRNV